MILTLLQTIEILGAGLLAGLLGGLAGVGGSLVLLPALHFIFHDNSRTTVHHLYMAAAMTVNIVVALPAAWRNMRSGRVDRSNLRTLLISTSLAMIVGVLVGNGFSGDALRLLLAGFIGVYCLFNLWRIVLRHAEPHDGAETPSTPRLAISGGCTGFIGGLLGLGGGVMLVPLLQLLCHIGLKRAIATSSTVICVTAAIGAGMKLATLSGEGESWTEALRLAAMLAPTAIIGGFLGAWLTHVLPTRIVRIVVTILLALTAARLAGLLG